MRLEVGQRISANMALPIGNSSETVEVQSDAINCKQKVLPSKTCVQKKRCKSLPLNGRNFAGLVGLGAGAVPAHTQLQNVPYTQQRGDTSYAFNGLRYQENRLLLEASETMRTTTDSPS